VGVQGFRKVLVAGVLVTGRAAADDVARDVGSGTAGVTLGSSHVTLSEARAFDEDPFVSPTPTWVPPMPTGGNAPFAPSGLRVVPELTLRLRPLLGFEPFLQARAFTPFQAGSTLDSDFGFRFRAGRFHAGARFSFLRDDRGLALDAQSYVRYVAPKVHVGLSDAARVPLGATFAPTHRLTASAGFKPVEGAPALHASTSVNDAGTEPRLATGLFGKF
jgi:hypothetical protein